MRDQTMKALSIRQPWAWLIVNGFKDIENRTWATKYRGKFSVHASKGMTRDEYEDCLDYICWSVSEHISLPEPEELQRGGIVGEAELVDCVQENESEWFAGPYGFVIRNAVVSPFVACRGALGFFEPEVPP